LIVSHDAYLFLVSMYRVDVLNDISL